MGLERREPFYTVGGNVNWYSHYGEQWMFLKKLKVALPWEWKWKKVLVAQSCPAPYNPMDKLTRLFCPQNSIGSNIGVGSHFLPQGIFPSQGLNLCLLHCRWILYHLSHQKRTLQSHSWAYIWRKTWSKVIHAPQCSLQHYLQ